MRLIATIDNEKEAEALTQALKREAIQHEMDPDRNTDWGSPEYGNLVYRLWITDEEQVYKALEICDKYKADPQDPLFSSQGTLLKSIKIPQKDKIKEIPSKIVDLGLKSTRPDISSVGPITFYILLICCVIFMADGFTQPTAWPIPSSLPLTELYASPVKRNLLFDYPHPYELFNKFVEKYTPEKVINPEELSPEAENNLVQILNIPYWEGLYNRVIDYSKNPETNFWPNVPWFEKIQQGELWRLFTPVLLHADIFHLLFNMLWLYALGRQIEQKLGSLRYIFFVLFTGVLTCLAQYLMTGSNFLGFSGILCAMITFIAARQSLAAWEGYRMDRMTKIFILVFILGMFGFQVVSFGFEVLTGVAFSPGIANTAHMSGLLLGYLMGRMPLFAWK